VSRRFCVARLLPQQESFLPFQRLPHRATGPIACRMSARLIEVKHVFLVASSPSGSMRTATRLSVFTEARGHPPHHCSVFEPKAVRAHQTFVVLHNLPPVYPSSVATMESGSYTLMDSHTDPT
jgi:hypothetical protein